MVDELEKKQSEMPSAFPNGNIFPGNRGLTMRDYFAAKAIQAILSNEFQMVAITKAAGDFELTRGQALAKFSYEIADEMMLAREKS